MMTPEERARQAIGQLAFAGRKAEDVIAAAIREAEREQMERDAGILETSGVMLPIIPGETRQDRCVRFALAMAQKIRREFEAKRGV